ncbi:ABC transporter permease subunit [Neobacillus notoginsengisoli]|uniref:ABC transporter permease subunit n=1 Tax=Neobacillus notoginsengisoli TaxID=1578198 RepID=A0A417Z018_9BACI|nr:ABC transporter permease subunit [Neobacillus notoginsengisoli]RHW43354.1 ABC transporter permease subunit [Neobacillus notoginsengisoli]
MLKRTVKLLIVVLLILVIASFPDALQPRSGNIIVLKPYVFLDNIQAFFKNLSDGSLGTYKTGSQHRSIAADVGDNVMTSFLLMFTSMLASVTVSLLVGAFFPRSRISKAVYAIFAFLSAIPQFILIIFLIFGGVSFYKLTGYRVITLSMDKRFADFLFPVFILSIISTSYLLKLTVAKYNQIASEDYVRTGLSKGLSKSYLSLHHIFKNLRPYFVADLKKTLSLTAGSLFIVEYLFNILGVTRFIFADYLFAAVAVGFLSIVLITMFVYYFILLILFLFEKGFVYE